MKYTIKYKDGKKEPLTNLSVNDVAKFAMENTEYAGSFEIIEEGKTPKEYKPKIKKETEKPRKKIEEEKELFIKNLNLGQKNMLANGYSRVVYSGGSWGLVATQKHREAGELHHSTQEKKLYEIMEMRQALKNAIRLHRVQLEIHARLGCIRFSEEDFAQTMDLILNDI